MQELIQKQSQILSKLEQNSKQDKIIQAAQLFSSRNIDRDGDRLESQLKDINKGIKNLNDKNGNGLNSNIIKLSDYIKKTTGASASLGSKTKYPLSPDQVNSVTNAAMGRRQYNTVRPRVENFKDSFKDFFSMRGFLDKSGIVKRNTGGIFSEYLDRGEEKKKYIDSRSKMDPTARLHGDKKSREIFGKQFDKQQGIQYEMQKNEKQLKEYQDQGFTESQISRSAEFKNKGKLAEQLAEVDSRVRPAGASAIIAQKGKASTSLEDSPAEAMNEQNRMVSEQTELLIKIEENTRGFNPRATKSEKPKAESDGGGGGLGLMDLAGGLGKKAIGGIAKGAGMLGKAGMGAARFLGKNPALLAAGAVATGAYTGYKAWGAAGDKEKAAKEEIAAKLESGEITKEEAAKLSAQAGEEGVVGKGKAAGKGTGMALGGAAGALKGAAAGAAIGSVVPVVGTAIGGLIGGTLGAVGGSYLGSKGGEYVGEKAGQLTNAASNAWDSTKKGASGLWEGAKGLAGDVGEGALRIKNKVSDVGWMAKENTSNLIDRSTGGSLTKAGNAISGAKNSVLGMFGLGDKVVKNADGSRTTFKSDGTRIEEGGFGTRTYDKSGKLISEKSPTFMGSSKEKRADGSTIESYDTGPMSLKKETTAAGGQQTTSSYDLGVTKVAMRETLTPRQMKERGIDAKMAAGLPSKIPTEGGKPTSAAFDKEWAQAEAEMAPVTKEPVKAGGAVTKIAGESWAPGKKLSDKQLEVMQQGIAGGKIYSYRVMEQYDKQMANVRAPVTMGAVSADIPGAGDRISRKSSDNEQAKMDASSQRGSGATVVSAPTTNVNNNTTQVTKLPTRNQDPSLTNYINSRYAF